MANNLERTFHVRFVGSNSNCPMMESKASRETCSWRNSWSCITRRFWSKWIPSATCAPRKKEFAVATVFCVECDQNICELCSRLHKKTKSLKDHQVYFLKDKELIEQTRLASKSFCVRHVDWTDWIVLLWLRWGSLQGVSFIQSQWTQMLECGDSSKRFQNAATNNFRQNIREFERKWYSS